MDLAVLAAAIIALVVVTRRRWWRPAAAAPAGAPDPVLRAPSVTPFILLTGLLFAGAPMAVLILHALGMPVQTARSPADLVGPLSLIYALQAPVIALVILQRIRSRPAAGTGGGRRAWRQAAIAGGIALACTWPIALAAGQVTARLIVLAGGPAPAPLAHETLRMIVGAERDAALLLVIAFVVLAAPIAEEVLYRGLIQPLLERALGGHSAAPGAALIATSVFFAFMHVSVAEPHAVVSLFVLSIGFGLVARHTGRLRAAVVTHVLFNAGNIVLAMSITDPVASGLH